jgi:hypothetical protein
MRECADGDTDSREKQKDQDTARLQLHRPPHVIPTKEVCLEIETASQAGQMGTHIRRVVTPVMADLVAFMSYK